MKNELKELLLILLLMTPVNFGIPLYLYLTDFQLSETLSIQIMSGYLSVIVILNLQSVILHSFIKLLDSGYE